MNQESPRPTTRKVQKVAILGGGPSSLSAAFELSDPSQGGRYDITLYQLGWRLGGKCASGRNPDHHQRVQEHGLHVFLGSYDNAFDIVRRTYDELGRDPSAPLSSWQKAVTGIDHVGLVENVEGQWKPWVVKVPRMPGEPGDHHGWSFFDLLAELLQWIGDGLSKHSHHLLRAKDPGTVEKPHWWDTLLVEPFERLIHGAEHAGLKLLGAAVHFAGHLAKNVEEHEHKHHHHLADLLHKLRGWVHRRLPEKLEDEFRHFIIIFDMILTNGIGALRDGLVFDTDEALPRVNELDYRAWLRSHDGLDIMVDSAIVRGLYDLIFAYPGGDVRKPGDVEAGTMFISLTQTARYHGSFMYKMNSGTGDVVAAPLYQVLARRGVKFRFFHRVTALEPSPDGNWIEQVRISRQVQLKADEYRPLSDINGLPSWSSEPDYAQIVEGEELKKKNIDLESRWTPWKDTGGELTLSFGKDYDWLVLGTSLEPLREICASLAAGGGPWADMLAHMETVQTQSVQMWFKPSLDGEGGINPALPPGVVLGAYDRDGQPIDTWADISEILAVESWPKGTVGNASIMCGPMQGPPQPPPRDDRAFPGDSLSRVESNMADFLDQEAETIWPGLYRDGKFDSAAVVDQYLRVNIDPSERYVLSRPGSSVYRLRAQDSGYRNLVLTGDWIQNGQNLGSFEASMTSGKLASRAISGRPEKIMRIPPNSHLYADDPPPQPGAARPPFVEHAFKQTFPGPVQLANTRMWSFWLPGDMDKLRALCAQCFTTPSGGAVEYLPITSQVLVSVVDIGRGTFSDVPEMGWSGERELAFWILMAKVKRKDGVLFAERLGLFNPTLVLDNPVAVATGRETYGYLKQQGWISVPGAGEPHGPLTVDAFATAKYGPDSEQQRMRFLDLVPVAGAKDGGPVAKFESLKEIARAARKALHADIQFAIPTLELAKQLFDDMIHEAMPQVFLKQFRDVADTRRACYQAIIETPIRVSGLRGVQLDTPHDLTIHPLDSLDVHKVLGVPNQHRVDFLMQLEMDMHLDTGRELWRA